MTRELNIRKIAEGLSRLFYEGGDDNFMIVTGDEERNYYLQFAASAGDPVMMIQAVNNTFLHGKDALSQEQIDWLLAIGFEQDEEDPDMNLQMFVNADDDETWEELGEMVVEILTDVYGVSPDVSYDIEIIVD